MGEGVSTLTANIEQTAHYSTMPKLFTRLDGAWPSHGNVQTRRELNEHFIGGAPFMEGQNSRQGRGKSQEPSNRASGCREWMQQWRDWSIGARQPGCAWLKLTKAGIGELSKMCEEERRERLPGWNAKKSERSGLFIKSVQRWLRGNERAGVLSPESALPFVIPPFCHN